MTITRSGLIITLLAITLAIGYAIHTKRLHVVLLRDSKVAVVVDARTTPGVPVAQQQAAPARTERPAWMDKSGSSLGGAKLEMQPKKKDR